MGRINARATPVARGYVWTVTFLLLSLLLQAQPGSLAAIERQVARAERSELREPGSDRLFRIGHDRLLQYRGQIAAYLQAKPDDPAAFVLLGRVERLVLGRSRNVRCGPDHGCAVDTTYNDSSANAAFDRAISLNDRDPAAHFWKARLLGDGRPVMRNGEFAFDIDTAGALAHAQRAVALDSRNVRYREFLAVTLSNMGRYQEAAEAIRPVQGGKHVLSLIFQDLAAVPIPEGAVPWPGGHGAFAAVGMDENPPRFVAQTGRSWATVLSLEQLEAFYRRRWPAFRFFRVQGDTGQTGGMQYLRLDRNGKLQPARDSAFIDQLESAKAFPGVLLAVGQSGPRFDQPGLQYPAAVAGKDVFQEIIIVTGRRDSGK